MALTVKVGRLQMTWMEVISRDFRELGICKENAADRVKWKRLIGPMVVVAVVAVVVVVVVAAAAAAAVVVVVVVVEHRLLVAALSHNLDFYVTYHICSVHFTIKSTCISWSNITQIYVSCVLSEYLHCNLLDCI